MNHEVDLKLLTVSGGLFEADGDKKKGKTKDLLCTLSNALYI